MNYLPDAHNHGAVIITQASVKFVKKESAGWRVVVTDLSRDGEPVSELACDVLILAAGTLGSTEILLRSREQGLALSDLLGRRFSGNGDVLGLGYNSYWSRKQDAKGKDVDPIESKPINGIGVGTNFVPPENYPGPCITGIIDLRKTAESVGEGLVIEEGSIPGALATVLPPALLFSMSQYGNFFQYTLADGKARLLEAQKLANAMKSSDMSLTDLAYQGAVSRTQTFLIMSHDDAGGTMSLAQDRLRIAWPGIGNTASIARDNDQLRKAAEANQGQFLPNPLWTDPFGKQLLTVHPLGGCRMGASAVDGVVDVKCRVFASGTTVHEGLYVMDGAVFPGSAGVNPLLTITAIAERACQLLAAERGWAIDYRVNGKDLWAAAQAGGANVQAELTRLYDEAGTFLAEPPNPAAELAAKQAAAAAAEQKVAGWKKLADQLVHKWPKELSPALSFRETMTGYFATGSFGSAKSRAVRVTDDFDLGYAHGKARGCTLTVHLLIELKNVHETVTRLDHAANVSGEIVCEQLWPKPINAAGTFNLLRKNPDAVETWEMIYDMVGQDADGITFHFNGRKFVRQSKTSDWWRDLTTLYVDLFKCEKDGERLVGKGIISLSMAALAKQATTVKIEMVNKFLKFVGDLTGMRSKIEFGLDFIYLEKFAAFFGMVLFRAYGGLLTNLANMIAADDAERLKNPRPLQAPAPTVTTCTTPDGFNLKFTRYEGGKKGPLILAPGFTVTASSFAADTVDQNLVECLIAESYDVWLFDYRASPDAGNTKPFDLDDIASHDWPTAVEHVRRHTGAPDVQVLVHCVAAMTFLMAKLKGLSGVRSALCSQLTLHPVNNWLNYVKADLNIASLLGKEMGQERIDIRSTENEKDRGLDAALWSLPVPEGEECTNPCCRRVFAVYGPSYTHAQLNDATHAAIHRWFGEINTKSFDQLTNIMRIGYVVDRNLKDTYLPCVDKIDIPITFIAGERNLQFLPQTSLRTLEWLKARLPERARLFHRYTFADYAHMDLFIGKNASKDVYPVLLGLLRELDQKAAPMASGAMPIAQQSPTKDRVLT